MIFLCCVFLVVVLRHFNAIPWWNVKIKCGDTGAYLCP